MSNPGKYGKAISDYLTSIKNAVNAGYENAEGIAEISSAVQIAGDITAELADRYIFATDKAYDLGGSIEKLREILDGTNAIADNNAINMADLAEGMSVAGQTAADLGISAKEAAAAIATILTATEQVGSEAAEAEIAAASWEASLNRLSNTWTDTIGNIADSGVITTTINGLNSLLTAVEHITDALGPVGSIAALSSGILGINNVGRLKTKLNLI